MKLKNLAALALCAAFTLGTLSVAACSSKNDDTDNIDITNTTHEHTLTKTEAVAVTCTTPGNKAYWHCSGCDKYFSDENATTEITLASTVIAAMGHTYEYKNDENGHWQECSVCGEKTEAEGHSFENGVCTVCAASEIISVVGNTYKFTDIEVVFDDSLIDDSTGDKYWTEERQENMKNSFSQSIGTTIAFNSDGTASFTYPEAVDYMNTMVADMTITYVVNDNNSITVTSVYGTSESIVVLKIVDSKTLSQELDEFDDSGYIMTYTYTLVTE